MTELDALTRTLGDRYRVEREIGAGGMATVYLAHLGTDRFLREIQLAAQLQHPHIVPLIDSGDAEGLLYYLMPYVDGETLRDRLRRTAPARSTKPSCWRAKSLMHWAMPIAKASSTATSSPRIFSWPTGIPSWPISESPGPSIPRPSS